MDKPEFAKFYSYITSITTDTKPSPQRMEVYWDALNDLPYEVAITAARKVIATLENPFLPMPAVFRGAALQVTGQVIQAAPDAYADVLKAIRYFGSYRETEALQSLPPLTRKAAESIGWKGLCLSEEPDVIRGQFRMAYEALEKRESTDARTPQRLKEVIAAMGGTPVKAIAERITPRMIEHFEEDETDLVEDINERSNNIRALLAKAVRNRPKQITKTSPEELEKFYL